MSDTLVAAIGDKLVGFAVDHGIPAAISLLVGSSGGAIATRFLKKNLLRNTDFKIISEAIRVVLGSDPAAKGRLRITVSRQYDLKLKDGLQKGSYEFQSELKGNAVSAKWLPGCQLLLNGTQSLALTISDEDTVLTFAPCKVTSRDFLRVALNSYESITKGRRFYALVISNAKDKTTMEWKMEGFDENGPKVKAYASSEDFDLVILEPDGPRSISESSHQVTYFFVWAEELFQ